MHQYTHVQDAKVTLQERSSLKVSMLNLPIHHQSI